MKQHLRRDRLSLSTENNPGNSTRRESGREDGELKMERWRVKMKASRPEIESSDPKASKVPEFYHPGKPLRLVRDYRPCSPRSPSDFHRTFVFSVFRRAHTRDNESAR